MPVFDEDFFKKLKALVNDIIVFIQEKWFWGVITVVVLILLIFFQQFLLFRLSGKI
jgi:hypothetical protein